MMISEIITGRASTTAAEDGMVRLEKNSKIVANMGLIVILTIPRRLTNPS
jgi:hypothetical protein